MLNILEEVKALYADDGIKKNIRVVFPNGEHPDLTNKDIVMKTFSFTESLCSQSDFHLGLCEASVVQFECVGVGNVINCKIKVFCEIDCSSLGAEWCAENATVADDVDFPFYSVPFGVFYISSCQKKAGVIKNRRVIKAYTREASDDWELPKSIESAWSMAWYQGKTFAIPVRAIEKATFSNLAVGEYTASRSVVRETPLKYRDSQGHLRDMNVIIMYKQVDVVDGFSVANSRPWRPVYESDAIFPFDGRTGSSISQRIFKYHAKVDDGFISFVNRCVNGIKEKVEENGFEMYGVDDALSRINNIRTVRRISDPFKNYYRITYDPQVWSGNRWVFNTVTEVYIGTAKKATDVKATVLNGLEQTESDYIYHERQYTTNTSISTSYYDVENDHITAVYVPYGIRFGSLSDFYVPEFIDQTEYTFDSTLEYFYDEDFSGRMSIGYTLDVSRFEQGEQYKQDASGSGTTPVSVTVYSVKDQKKIELRNIIEADAELMGMFGKFDRFGEFEYISVNRDPALYPRTDLYPGTRYPKKAPMMIRTNDYVDAYYEDAFSMPYDRVSCTFKNLNDEDDYVAVYLVDIEDEYYNPDAYQSYTIGDNWFIKNQKFDRATITELLNQIAENVRNISYMPADVQLKAKPWIEAGDYVTIGGSEDMVTLTLRNTISGEQFMMQTIESN